MIRDRGYVSGERIGSERDLADRFDVSRPMLREALSVLESMRVIERRPQSGIYMRDTREVSLDLLALQSDLGLPLSQEDVRDLNEFRQMLEVQAIGLACRNRSDEDLAAIDAILQLSQQRLAAGESLAAQDAQFHMAICAASGNRLIRRAAHSFWLASSARRELYFANAENARRSLRQHRALRDAIGARDTSAAMEVLGLHLGNVERFWRDHVGAQGGGTSGRK
ncbi:hypothetical protein ASG30_20295 [Ramlibacter sp. Leaf400]|nr:hypothetical protein ASG30_20295 [Ramlibacter sp. Leaf400]